MKRRQFLNLMGTLPLAALAPASILSAPAASAATGNRVLVLVELFGGNDGLNTVIPYADPLYRKFRPNLAIQPDQIIKIDPKIGLHPSMRPIVPLWRNGELAIALGVGYPAPIFSHFRGIKVWDSASDRDGASRRGWITRVLEENDGFMGRFKASGVMLGRNHLGPLESPGHMALTMNDVFDFPELPDGPVPAPSKIANPALDHIANVQNRLDRSFHASARNLLRSTAPGATFPGHGLGRQFQSVARLIAGGFPVPVYKLSLEGFDGHANHSNFHSRLLAEMAEAFSAFAQAMKFHGLWDQVLVMTYAKFGRRVAENGSLGTDHGTAAPHFLFGGRVRGGFYGAQPGLDNLNAGNLTHTVHFRELYASVINEWWHINSSFIGERGLKIID